jgi:uncharacterized repeat protein (TIGR01451 family)
MGAAQATPGHPGSPDAATVVFHEDFEKAPDSGPRSLLSSYVGVDGRSYTAAPYWLNPVKANGMVLSWGNSRQATDATGADNGTEVTAFNTLRQLSEAIGKINGTKDPQTNTVVSAYTQDQGPAAAGNKIMFATKDDIKLKDAEGRYLAFSMSAAATNGKDKAHPDRENPQLMFYVSENGVETPLSTTPIDPITDGRAVPVAVTTLAKGAAETVYAGQYASDKSFLYEGGEFGIVIRNITSAHLGNDGAFDDIKVLDVTPQLDKEFGQTTATTGDSVRLTFTVTNTAELANKKGWSFTDSLPAGLVVAADPDLAVDGTADVKAEPGADAIVVTNGDLRAHDNALTISLNVTAAKPGTYTNGPANITVRKGLDSPDKTTVVFKDPEAAPANLVVRYVDEGGQQLATPGEDSGPVGREYTTSPKDIAGYELISVPTNASGRLAEGTTEVVYVYKKKVVAPAPADLKVRWVTDDGKPLADPYVYRGVVDEKYTTDAKKFDGYTLVAVPVNATGALRSTPTEVVYVYKKNTPAPAPADLTVRFVDEKGNPLVDPTHRDGTKGEHYDTTPAIVPGYELVKVPANASGAMEPGTEVVYVYKKLPVTPVTPEQPSAGEVVQERPGGPAAHHGSQTRPVGQSNGHSRLASTGSSAVIAGGLAAAAALAGAALVLVRRRALDES